MINKITEYVSRDPENYKYYMSKDFASNTILANFKNYVEESNLINLPYVSEVVANVFPYIQSGIKQDIIDRSIEQGICVHDIVSKSIKDKKSEKIRLFKTDCKNQNHISAAIKIISVLNSFIYKHKIKYFYSEETFISLNKFKYLGTPDILLGNDSDWFLIDIKTSRTNFVEKAEAQLFLYKEMIESANEIKIKASFILNPREEIAMYQTNEPSTKDKNKLHQYLF